MPQTTPTDRPAAADPSREIPGVHLDPHVEAHPLVQSAHELAADLLEPQAAAVDAGTVPRSHLDALAQAGIMGMQVPPELGGRAVPGPVIRRVHEILAGADLATWFVHAQHHSPTASIAQAVAGGRDDLAGLLKDLGSGRRLAGVAFSHLRRWPTPVVAAHREPGGWTFTGEAPWYTGWGINDLALVSATTQDGRVVSALVEPSPDTPGLSASEPMALAALASTVTVRLRLDGVRAPDAAVVRVQPIAEWAVQDRLVTANTPPAVIGVAAAALRHLTAGGPRGAEPAAAQAASAIGARLARVRSEALRYLEQVPPERGGHDRLALRAEALHVMAEATTALVAAGGGRSMANGAVAERLARGGLFLIIQAQTHDVRTATLHRWATG